MAEKDPMIEKEGFDGKKVQILGETYAEGVSPVMQPYKWRSKIQGRQNQLRFLETGLRYWYAEEGFGSEKRKTPA